MKKKIVSMVCAMALAAFSLLVSGPLRDNPGSVLAADKIDDDLVAWMEESSPGERIPVDIWLTEIDIQEVDELLEEELKKVEGQFEPESLEYVTNRVETRRAIYASMEEEKNQAFIDRYPDIQALHDDRTYVSKYSPVISTKLTAEELSVLSEDDEVCEISILRDLNFVEELVISEQTIRATYTRDTLYLKGGGIKIGMIDKGMPNRNAGYFNASNIHLESDENNAISCVYSEHATGVAYVICGAQATYGGVTYQGIVPNATLYATYYNGVWGSGSDWHARVEWLLSKGVIVINMSIGDESGEGTYTNEEKWLDHIGINHSVHFVKSAGDTSNEEEGGYITIPGMAYNIVTVGAIDTHGTADQWGADDTIPHFTSIYEANDQHEPNKPDIAAPGTNIAFPFVFTDPQTGYTSHIISGTSYAAPQVTAIIAQMCQEKPALVEKQACMKAVLAAGTTHALSCKTGDADMNLIGAGVVDARGAHYVASNNRFVATNFPASTVAGTTVQYQFTVNGSDAVVRVALSWLANVDFGVNNHVTGDLPARVRLANLDLVVKNSNGVVVGTANSEDDNLEVVMFSPNGIGGTYTIEVTLTNHAIVDPSAATPVYDPQIVYYGVAWW